MRAVRSIALVVVVALIASLAWAKQAPPAFAADPGVDKLVSTLNGASDSVQAWTQDLATVGKLADSLPLVHTSPGSVLEFGDLLSKVFSTGAHKISDATTDSDFTFTQPISISDDRTGTLTSQLTTLASGDKKVDVTVDVSRTIHDQPMNVNVPIGADSNGPQSAFTSEKGVDLAVHGTINLSIVWDHTSNTVYIIDDGTTTPSIHIGADAHFGNINDVKASIGILGVSLVNDSTLSLTSNLVASISDPNNDGRIAFENTDHSAGELAQPGSLAGYVTFGFDSPAGALHASLHLTAATSADIGFTLPQVDATIGVEWPDVSTGSPTVTPTNIGSVGDFLNMSPRDLADDLGQLVTTLTSLQHAKSGTDPHFGNIDLPFFKGSLADAIQLNESLKKFLTDNTVSAAVDAAKAGDPTFVSLQELLDRLDTATGLPGGVDLTIPSPSIGFDSATHKLKFTIGIAKAAPVSPLDLNAAAAAVSGGPGTTYTDTTLTDNSQDWSAQNFAGRHVVAGLAGATVASNTAHTLTLQVPAGGTVAWAPTAPAAGSAYSISGAEGDVGIPQLGNALQSSGHGILNANAVNATAKVKPSYSASIALVLDLTPPTFHDPPLPIDNPDGTTTLVTSTPLAADRLLVDTDASAPLLSADFPIDGNIDIFANAGFLQVELKGAAHVCQSELANCSLTPSSSQHMLKVAFKPNGLMNFGEIVHELLTDPAGLLDFQVKVRGEGSIDVTVPSTTDFFHGGTAGATFHWNDLTQTTGTDGPQFDISDLSELVNFDFDPSNPKALFSIILKTLQTLDKTLGDGDPSGASVFNTKIPLVGRSLHDLLKSDESGLGPNVTYTANTVTDSSRSVAKGNQFKQSLVGRSIVAGTQVGIVASVSDTTLTMASNWTNQPSAGTPYTLRSELDDAISILQNSPSDNLQALVKTLNDRLSGLPIKFDYRDDASVGSTPSLVINLDWTRDFHTSAPVSFDFSLPAGPGGGDHTLAGVQGSGQVSLGAGGEIKLGLVVPLAPGTGPQDSSALQILDDSNINVHLTAGVDDATLSTTIGPLSISLGDPTSSDKATAHASYSIDLAQPGGSGNAESFDDFFGAGGVEADINASSAAAHCGLADENDDLALCAKLPLYFSSDGGTTYTKLIADPDPNAFNIRLPKSAGSLTDYFDLTGAQINGHDRIEYPDPTLLANAIASHLIDFTRLDGLDSFLNLIEQSLNTASFGGKLPLIGDDLQQGADFIGKIRDAVHDALSQLPANGNFADMAGVRDWVNDKLAQALDDAGVNPDLAKLDTVCSTSLGVVGSPSVALHSGATAAATIYNYKVAAYITVGADKKQSQPSAIGSIANGPAALSATDSLDISWTAVTGANGYKVFRDTGGGTFKEVADVASGVTFTDDGTATPGDEPENPAENPKLHDCSYDALESVVIVLDLSQGDFSGDTLDCTGLPAGHECIDKTVPLNIGIPGLSLKASQAGEGPHVQLGYRLHLAFGISRDDGFFVDTKDGDPQPELAFGLNFTLPSQIEAQLAFINITATNCDDTMTADCITSGPDKAPAPGAVPPLFGGTFKIDLTSPHSNGRLTIDDLGSASLDDLFDLKLHAGVNIDWLLKAKVGDDAGFPGIQTEFRMSWAWNNQAPGDNSGGGVDPLAISFKRVQIDAGDVFGQVIGPIIKEIKKVTGPLDPIIKTLYAPIPVLSDLSHLVGGDDVTLVSIAKAFSTLLGGPDLTFVDTIVAVIKVINEIPDGSSHVLIPIGSFDVAGGSALDNTATPDNTESLISAKNVDAGAADGDGILGNLDQNDSGGNGGHDIMNGTGDPADSDTGKAGFEFPVFQHPATLFNLLMGGDVTLVTFDSGPLTLGFDWRQEFGPVYAPPPVLITLHGSASVTLRIKAGFDTYGIRKAFEKVRNGEAFDISVFGEAILQSLFFATVDNDGKPLPVVTFRGEIAAGAEVSAVIITVGIEGGVGLEISFLWNDPNNDGKFRISEFLQAALNNPICLFVVSGRVYVFLKLFVKIGFGPFSVSFDFTIVDVTLLDFSVKPDCTPPPPKLGGLSGDGHTLIVYAAALGHTAQRGHSSYESNDEDKDTVKITSLHDYADPNNPTFKGVGVEMLGIRREFLNTNIDRVVVYGAGYTKPMKVTFLGDGKSTDTSSTGAAPPTASFEKDTIVFGGTADDSIKTGIGRSWVDGGGGNDTIVTGDRTVLNKAKTDYLRSDAKAYVAGGAGDDGITVGNGNDRVAGDSTLGGGGLISIGVKELGDVESGDPAVGGPSLSVPDWNSIPEPTSGEGSGTPNGKDKISLGLGNNKGYGNGGDDTLSVAADNSLAKVKPALASILTSQGDTLVGGTGSDNIAAGTADDTIYTAAETTFGVDAAGPADTGATNVVDTGTGSDTVYGGTGIDLVTGHSLPPHSPPQTDTIQGGDANDILIGGYGTDKIYGGPGDDYVLAEPSHVDIVGGDDGFGPVNSVSHDPLPSGAVPQHKLLVGGLGRDHIVGGDGSADIYGDQLTTPCVAGAPVASDPVDESVNTVNDGNDKITGGAGVENVRAGGGNDNVDVKANDDLVCGEKGDDVLQGGSDADQEWGGSGADTMYGDTGSDMLYGNADNDTIYGSDGLDQIEGNNGTDWVAGGNDGDVIIGGTRAAGRDDQRDFLSGDNGVDIIIGDNGNFVGGVWVPLDLTGLPATAGGSDFIWGGANDDTCHGGIDDDFIFGGSGNDHCEGNAGNDTMSGQDGEDELIGGGYETASAGVGFPDGHDTINGGDNADVITGDNAVVTTVSPASLSTDTLKGRSFTLGHTIALLDLGYSPTAGTSDGDFLHGNDGTDVIYGQGGDDTITGDENEDYAEGGPGVDTMNGNGGQDDLVGGSTTVFSGSGAGTVGQPDTGDIIHGDDEADVIIGDNGKVLRDPAATPSPLTDRPGMATQRAIVLYDLQDAPHANSSGDDDVTGDNGVDVILGQDGNDRLKGNAGDDYIEGDQGSDWVEGNAGEDDLVGGSSTAFGGSGLATTGQLDGADAIYGGANDDVITGDNALVLRTGARTSTTDRIGSIANTRLTSRSITLFDLNSPTFLTNPPRAVFGGDRLSGGSETDVIYGQDGNDQASGGPGADYMEGNGGADIERGDLRLDQAPPAGHAATTPLATAWPGSASALADLEGNTATPDGQDDMLGGSSRAAFRDGDDQLEGDGESDFQLGDNGTLKRDVSGTDGVDAKEAVFVQRYSETSPIPANAAVIRKHDPAVPNPNGTTRFCTTAQATCEVAGAFGADTMWGDGGDDTMWGQDGNDAMHGGDNNDDMYGELGNDTMFGDAGNDAMLGDRGGVVDELMNPSDIAKQFDDSTSNPPKESFTGFRQGTLDHRIDLLHDIDGDAFVGTSLSAAMPHAGLTEGGIDRIRGGLDRDNIHGGFGDDLMNGDSGGDVLFGDDGADIIWGGQGCDAVLDVATQDCLVNGVFDRTARGTNDRFVDHIFGGVGGSASTLFKKEGVDPDILDWRPRGTYTPGTGCTLNPFPQTIGNSTIDPCSWFEMTDTTVANVAVHQHHQGTDWMYGGWDRDVMQGDVAQNGPNPGDRLLDWTGAYNLYTHCNSAYGGFNDVRQHSPDMQQFLQQLTYADGAGQVAAGGPMASDSLTPGTSAFRELAFVYPSDNNAHGSGSAFPTTPGHFDDPSCAD